VGVDAENVSVIKKEKKERSKNKHGRQKEREDNTA
jgi:hypothetical protein